MQAVLLIARIAALGAIYWPDSAVGCRAAIRMTDDAVTSNLSRLTLEQRLGAFALERRMTTKVLALTNALGNLIRFALPPRQHFDTGAPAHQGVALRRADRRQRV